MVKSAGESTGRGDTETRGRGERAWPRAIGTCNEVTEYRCVEVKTSTTVIPEITTKSKLSGIQPGLSSRLPAVLSPIALATGEAGREALAKAGTVP